jgi:hypothetical protein
MRVHPDDDTLQAFAQLLGWHLLVHGTRPSGQEKSWTKKEFADRLDVDERTVRNWLAPRTLPLEIASIEREIFGTDTRWSVQKIKLREAYRKAADAAAKRRSSGAEVEQISSHRNHNPFISVQYHRRTAIVFSRDKAHYVNRIVGKVLSDGLDCYNVWFRWLGEGHIDFEVVTPQAEPIPVALSASLDNLWRLMLGRRYKRGEQFELEFIMKVETHGKRDKPYYGTIVHEDTPRNCELILAARFDPDSSVQQIWSEEYFPANDVHPIFRSEKAAVPLNREFIWPLPWQRGHRYCICWEFGP